jgi:hypothetical protein
MKNLNFNILDSRGKSSSAMIFIKSNIVFKNRTNDNIEMFQNSDIGSPSVSITTNSTTSHVTSPTKLPQINNNYVNEILGMTNLADEYDFISETIGYSEVYQKKLVEEFLTQLKGENEIEVESMGKVMEILYNNNKFAKVLIDSILDKRPLYIRFYNLHNLQHFANILNTISLHFDHISAENYDLNFAIIYLAERTFYTPDPKFFDKVYLCSLLSKNKLYSTRTFWLDLIEMKLKKRVEDAMFKMENKIHNTYFEKDSGVFGNLGSKIGRIFGNDPKEKDKDSLKDTPIISSLMQKSPEIAKIYERLPLNKKNLADKVVLNQLTQLINEYIPHFANFNYDISEAIDLIVEISTKYKITKEKISYFVTMLNSFMFTIKNRDSAKKNIKKNLQQLNQKPNEFKMHLFLSSVNYLLPKDVVNILCLNKTTSAKLSKKIYRKMLNSKTITLKQRIEIWKSLLNIVSL